MRFRSGWWVIPLYTAAALGLTWPLAAHLGSRIPAVFGAADPLLQLFLIGWGWHALTHDPLGAMNAPIFHPEPRTLTYSDHMLGEAVLAGPVTSIFGAGAGYNWLVILSFVLSGWGLYRLARLLGVSRMGSCLAGFLFAFCPYRFSNLGELIQLHTQFLPWALFFAFRFLRTRRLRDGAGAALTLAVQSYFGWYVTFHLLIAFLLLLAWTLYRERGAARIPWLKAAFLALGAGALMLPGLVPYLLQHRALPEFHRSLGVSVFWSADLLDYLRLPPENVLSRLWPAVSNANGIFPGLVAVALAAAGWRRRPEAGYFALLAGGSLVLSLGPILQVAGHKIWIPLPYALCYYVIPGFSSMRAPIRFAVLVALAVAVLAAFGFERLRRRRPGGAKGLFALGLAAATVLAWSPKIPLVAVPDREGIPPVYAWLRDRPGSEPVLELPVPVDEKHESERDTRRQYFVLLHGKPHLDGASGFVSNRYREFRRRMQAFPDPDALRAAREMGAKLVIVHYGEFAPPERARIRDGADSSPALRRLAVFGDDVVYALEPAAGTGSPRDPEDGG